MCPAEETHVIDAFFQMHPFGANVCSTFTGLHEFKGALHKVPLARRHGALFFAAAREFFKVPFAKLRLRIKCIDVRRSAFHHQEDAAFRFRRMMRFARGCNWLVRVQHGRQRDRTQARTQPIQEFTAIQIEVAQWLIHGIRPSGVGI